MCSKSLKKDWNMKDVLYDDQSWQLPLEDAIVEQM